MRTVHKLVAAVAVLPTVVVCLALVAVAGTGPHATPEWRYPVMPWQAAYLNITNDHGVETAAGHQPSQTGSRVASAAELMPDETVQAHVRRTIEDDGTMMSPMFNKNNNKLAAAGSFTGNFGNVPMSRPKPPAMSSSWTFSRMQTTTAGKELSTLRAPVTPSYHLDSEQVVHNLGVGGRLTQSIQGKTL
jgi:hypothetical protein